MHPSSPLAALDPNFVTWAVWTLAVTLIAGIAIKVWAHRADRRERVRRSAQRLARRRERTHTEIAEYVAEGSIPAPGGERLIRAIKEPGDPNADMMEQLARGRSEA